MLVSEKKHIDLKYESVFYIKCRTSVASKLCGTTSLWFILARGVIGPSANRGEEQSYNIQRVDVRLCVKNNVFIWPFF